MSSATDMEEAGHLAPPASTTVVICAFSDDRWDELCAAVASVAAQTCPVDQCLLVIDHNPTLLRRALEAFPDVEVIENEQERGLAGARNSGVSHARGGIVAFLDDDAWAEPEWLGELVGPYADPSVIGTGGLIVPDWDGSPPPWFPEEFYWVVGCSYRGLPEMSGSIRNPIGASMSFRRSVFDEVGPFSANIGRIAAVPLGCEETELAIRALRHYTGSKIVHAPDSVVHHRVGRERLSAGYFARRCFAEGISKSVVARRVGWRDGLSAERTFTRKILGSEVARGMDRATHGEARGVATSFGIALGLAATSLGFGIGRTGLAESATKALAWTPRRDRQAALAGGRDREESGTRENRVRRGGADAPAAPRNAGSAAPRDWAEGSGLSVVICTHRLDRWAWLVAAVRSVERQTIPVDDIVVVVDGNPELAERAADQLGDSCTVVPREVCGGLSEARNSGLAAVTAPFVAFFDDDAAAAADWLERLMEPMVDPDVLGVGGRSEPVWERGEPAWFPSELLWVVGCSYAGLPLEVSPVRNVFGGCAVYRRELFDRYGGFRSDFGRHQNDAAGCEETEFCLRVSGNDTHGRFVYQPRAVIFHHVPAGRATVRYVAKRSFADSRSKALLVTHVPHAIARRDLETEIRYARQVVARAFVAGLQRTTRGEFSGLAQSGVLALSMVTAACGLVAGFDMRSRPQTVSSRRLPGHRPAYGAARGGSR